MPNMGKSSAVGRLWRELELHPMVVFMGKLAKLLLKLSHSTWRTNMKIKKVIVENYKSLRKTKVEFSDPVGLIVGDNEIGKTSLLEAINLGLTAQLNGRHVGFELHPFLFNIDASEDYLVRLKKGETVFPPVILIEVYFENHDNLAALKGSINSCGDDCPGLALSIEFDAKYDAEYEDYISKPDQVTSIPIEYLKVVWRSFSDQEVTSRSIPVKCSLIDATAVRHDLGASRYVTEVMAGYLSPHDRARLGLSYRKMKDQFLQDPSISEINKELEKATGVVSNKKISIGLDHTARSKWEAGIMPHLDEIPFPLVGKGEQTGTKIRLALEAGEENHILLVEEPENHQSHTNLNALLSTMHEKSKHGQMIVTTHSSFVLNKLGLTGTILFDGDTEITLEDLPPDTKNYFLKLSGHDTLRLILAKRAILVEGPSDELIVQKAYFQTHGKDPLADGTEIISVRSLAFKRFLDIAKLLAVDVRVVTDNDGDVEKLKKKYEQYVDLENIRIYYDEDVDFPTLEPQLLKANGRNDTNKFIGKAFENDADLLGYMKDNKTDCALCFFDAEEEFVVPGYIKNAIEK